MRWCKEFCYGVHMPLFMFVSGGLFYATRIKKEWKWKDVVVDKLKRLGIPYIFFITFAFGLKALMAGKVKNEIDISMLGFLQGFVYPLKSGMKEMWFVAALLLLMFCYPLYKRVLSNKKIEMSLLLIAIVLNHIFISYTGGGLLNWQGALHYLVYFYAGILFFKYNLIEQMSRCKQILIGGGTLLYSMICIYKNEFGFIVAAIGIVTCIAFCSYASKRFPRLFSSFRDYSFQIFLLGIYPQMFVELVLGKRFTEIWQLPILLVVSILLGIYVSVGVAKLVQKINNKYLNMVLGLK